MVSVGFFGFRYRLELCIGKKVQSLDYTFFIYPMKFRSLVFVKGNVILRNVFVAGDVYFNKLAFS